VKIIAIIRICKLTLVGTFVYVSAIHTHLKNARTIDVLHVPLCFKDEIFQNVDLHVTTRDTVTVNGC
jgi:hypothetical protein